MSDSMEPTDTATEVADDISEVEATVNGETTSDDVSEMSEAEFAEFEEKSFKDESSGDDADEPAEPKDLTYDELETAYKTQMGNQDAKLANPIVIKLNGKHFQVDNINELKNLAELGSNSTQRFQAIAQHRKTLDFMEDNGISREDLDFLVQSRGQAPVTRNETADAVENIASEILNGPGADAFAEVASQLPDDVREVMSKNPKMLSGFNHDVQSGLAAQIMELVPRMMSVNQMSFMQAYQAAGDQVTAKGGNRKAPKQQQQQIDPVADKRNTLMSQPTPSAKVSSNGLSREDIDKMSDADFEKYYATV